MTYRMIRALLVLTAISVACAVALCSDAALVKIVTAASRASTGVSVVVGGMGVFPLLKSLLPVVVAFLLPTTDTLDHRRVGNGTHRHGLFQEPMEELPAMA